MSLYQQGITLKALLEDPNLINPPKLDSGDDKKKTDEFDGLFNPASAFLGPQLWENDLKIEYMDLDEFLHENCLSDVMPSNPASPNRAQVSPKAMQLLNTPQHSPGGMGLNVEPHSPNHGLAVSPHHAPHMGMPLSPQHSPPLPKSPVESQLQQMLAPTSHPAPAPAPLEVRPPVKPPLSPTIAGKIVYDSNKQDIMLATAPGQEEFNPSSRQFSEEELRPQPMIKKSKKVFVPNDMKDDKYWSRRQKNNVAAKRSRDARRIKENQIALRASFLEKENDTLRDEVASVRSENKALQARIEALEKMAAKVSPSDS